MGRPPKLKMLLAGQTPTTHNGLAESWHYVARPEEEGGKDGGGKENIQRYIDRDCERERGARDLCWARSSTCILAPIANL